MLPPATASSHAPGIGETIAGGAESIGAGTAVPNNRQPGRVSELDGGWMVEKKMEKAMETTDRALFSASTTAEMEFGGAAVEAS